MLKIKFLIIFRYKRLYVLYGGIFIMFLVLSLRLIYFQIISSDYLVREGNKRSLRIQNILEFRGLITDRTGQVLAINIPVYSIWVDPYRVNEFGGINANIVKWRMLSDKLKIPWEKLLISMTDRHLERFFYLSRQVDFSIANRIDQLQLPGVYIRSELKRYYPSGAVAAHLIGITNIDNQGIEGVEKSFDHCLSGYPQKRIIHQDRSGCVVEDVNLLDQGRAPQSISLSIDERLQYIAYHELNNAVNFNRAESGSVILININTGEILAMANSPSYDPNNLAVVDTSTMRNRAITDVFEPGSTIKPIVIMTALEQKIIEKDTIVETLPYMIHGHQIRDVSYNPQLTISEILKKSSNIGISKLALSMPVSVLVNAYLDFGLGRSTNIGLVGESTGKIYSCDRYLSEIEHATLSYGYGIMLTPLQLAKMYATIGGMGVSRPLSILKIDEFSSSALLTQQVFPKALARTVLDMMEITTLSSSGCYQAAIKGYRVSVKTGTIKKVGSHGKYIDKYIACIAGVAPSTNPQFALVVVINDPKNGCYYGSLVSAPVFKAVMGNALKIMSIDPDFIE